MRRTSLTKRHGVSIVREMKAAMLHAGIPIIDVYLFGSLATGKTHPLSDIDVAVVYQPFNRDPLEERRIIRRKRQRFDVPMDIVCLRREDMDNKYSTVVQEVKRHGIPV